jgi:competence protein ComEC
MVLFTLSFTFGVWLLQQQAALPDFVWAYLLIGLPIPLLLNGKNLYLRGLRIVLIAAFACALGFYHAAWIAQQRLSIGLADEWQGRDIAVIGVVAELPRVHEQGLRFAFDVEQMLTPQASVPPHIYLSTYYDPKTEPLALKAG